MLATFLALSVTLVGAVAYYAFLSLTAGQAKHLGDENAPVAAALVFDTSPRMGLRHHDRTRLEEAQHAAKNLLQKLPADSEVAIVDASGPGVFSVDIGNAVNMVESLQITGSEYPLVDLILRGLELVAKREDKRQEVYVLSDLSAEVWKNTKFQALQTRLEQLPGLSLFVLDVGSETPRNVQIGELRLGADSLATGQTLRIETSLKTLNVPESEVTVDVAIEKQDLTRPVIVDDNVLLPESVIRRRKDITLSSGAETPIVFEVPMLEPGVHHGRVQIPAQDGLPVDNQRYFTVEVRPPVQVLLVTSTGAEPKYVEQAISPTELREQGLAAFNSQVVDPKSILSQTLSDYAVIALLDPIAMPEAVWKRLESYVRTGGGVAVFLGRNAVPVARFNETAESMLPGKLGAQWRTAKGDYLFISLNDTSHPMMRLFRGRESNIAWDTSPIFRHWSFSEMKPGANVILRYSNDQPAIVEMVIGSGRVLTMTTPMSDRRRGSEPWNYLPTSEDPLPFFMLMYGMFPYLANPADAAWNHPVGDVVEIRVPDAQLDSTWQLFTPQLDWQNVRSKNGRLIVSSTEAPGHYRLKLDQDTATGFSTNLTPAATQLQRLEPTQLDKILGKDRFTLARGAEELTRGIGRARVGRELFPFLMLCVVGILVMEYLVSNRFYSSAV